MLNTDNRAYRTVLVASLIAIVVGLAISIMNIFSTGNGFWINIGGACGFIALLFAAYYIIKGYTKKAANYFKTFSALFGLSELLLLIGFGANTDASITIILSSIIYGLIIFITVGKDLGKKVSFAICGVIILFSLINLVISLVNYPGAFMGGDDFGTQLLGRNASQTILSCLLSVLTYAKYLDKKARGRD